nr:phosphopantetheine-binding protein [uncultured Lachnoclostridium sp.]
MERNEIKEKVFEVAGKLFGQDTAEFLDKENLVDAFSMTSIDVLEFLLAIETEFDFEFDDEYLDETTLQDINVLLDYIEEQM